MDELSQILKLANCIKEEEQLEIHDSFDIELSDDVILESGIIGFVEDGIIIEGDDKLIEILESFKVTVSDTIYLIEQKEDPELADIMGQLDTIAARPDRTVPSNVRPLLDLADYKERRKHLMTMLMRPDLSREERNQIPKVLAQIDAEAEEKGFALSEEELAEMMIMGNSNEPAESLKMDEAEYQGRKVSLNKPMQGDVAKFKVYVKKPNGKVVKVNFGDPNMRIKKSNPARRKSFRARHRCSTPGPKWKARYWSCRKW